MAFADNLQQLPSIAHLSGLQLRDASGALVASLENKPGQAGSVAVYAALAERFGHITPEAAAEGVRLYAEHSEDARLNAGKHPNIDRLFGLIATGTSLWVTVLPKA
ncbi:MAG: hypothetical protein RLZZ618_1337 [Pseudomonadota bacterium]